MSKLIKPIETREEMWKAIVFYKGKVMATFPRAQRNEIARSLLLDAERFDFPPEPSWYDVLEHPLFYDEWGERIASGKDDDEQVDIQEELGSANSMAYIDVDDADEEIAQ